MNLMSGIFTADHKPKVGFNLNMTFKLCMALGATRFFCGVMERAKIRAERNARRQMMMKRKATKSISKCTKSASAEEKELEEGI